MEYDEIKERGVKALERIATVLENLEEIYNKQVQEVEEAQKQVYEEMKAKEEDPPGLDLV